MRSGDKSDRELLADMERERRVVPRAQEHDAAWTRKARQPLVLMLRENALVLLTQLAGRLELMHVRAGLARSMLDGLIHWMTSDSPQANEPFPLAYPP